MGETPGAWLDDEDPRRLAVRVERVLRAVRGAADRGCARCAATLCGHGGLFALVLGHEEEPLCLDCLAADSGRPSSRLRDDLALHVQSKECLAQGWRFANLVEGFGAEALPSCHWEEGAVAPARPSAPSAETPRADAEVGPAPAVDEVWDAGDQGCGELVLALRKRVAALPSRGVLHLRATDPGAREDIPAWCRLTGHRLAGAEHPDYFIERKD